MVALVVICVILTTPAVFLGALVDYNNKYIDGGGEK